MNPDQMEAIFVTLDKSRDIIDRQQDLLDERKAQVERLIALAETQGDMLQRQALRITSLTASLERVTEMLVELNES